ncbi:glucose-6-phosphate dehydrogenase [Nocardia sp. NPDC088792]|uniref:glucose-6-phosphate dehydrogenase n=1 Tax=Nocardia sp. NPDC088792 TaxID=3364332 RepID=UPI00380FA081
MATESSPTTADLLVIFGITGDLARKMTFRSLYLLERRGLLDCRIIGVAGRPLTDAALVETARTSIEGTGEKIDEEIFDRFAARLSYLNGDVQGPGLYQKLAERAGKYRQALYYLEMPPSLFGPIVEQLAAANLLENARVALEKPFGNDLPSAQALNTRLHKVIGEDQLLRVDHFLGKEPVIELEYVRFANLLLAQVWDRASVSCIQITMAENFGVEDRGKFYDPVGALRDVVQNHLLQVLALVTMEPLAGGVGDELRDKKAEVLRAIRPVDPKHCVRGQYNGYLDVPGVAAGSDTESFVAMRLEIDNWRWSGVPVFLRAGKALAETVTEVRLILHRTPRLAFADAPARIAPNQIVIRIDPNPGLRLQIAAHDEKGWRSIDLDTLFRDDFGALATPYEKVLEAGLTGDSRFFAREDAVEETWRIVQPLLDAPPPVTGYARGSWGPSTAALTAGFHGWQEPWLDSND